MKNNSLNERVWFITAFMEVDYTENTETSRLLVECGNAFTTEAEAVSKLKQIQSILCARH